MKTTARRSECLPSSRCFFYLCKSQCAGCTCNSAVVNSVLALLTVTRTFISGFFGMNTADIHDTEAGQSLYWMIAIPVTVTVLALAFVYWYKGDEIGDWIHEKTHDTDRRQWKSTIKVLGLQRGTIDPSGGTRTKWPAMGQTQRNCGRQSRTRSDTGRGRATRKL